MRSRFYFGDYVHAFTIGEPPDEARRIVEAVDRVQRAALSILRPGLRCGDFYNTVGQLIAAEGYAETIPRHLGHGVGIGDDIIPDIVPTSEDQFVEGEVVCVEPGIYVQHIGGARIEDIVIVRANGNEILSTAPRVGRC